MEVLVHQIERRSWIEINMSQLRTNYLLYKKKIAKACRYNGSNKS